SVWPAMSILCPGRSSLKRSAIASAHTDDVEAPDPAAPLDAVLAAAVLAATAPLTGASPSGKSTALPVRKWAWVMGSTVALLLTPSTAKSCSCLAASLRHVRYSAPSADVGGGRTANS